MKIDRSLFVLLTGTLAAAACAAEPPAKTPPTVASSAPAATAPAASTAAAGASTAVATASVAPAPTESTPPAASSAPAPTASVAATTPPPASTTPPAPPKPPIDPAKQKPLGIDQGCAQSTDSYDDTRTACDDNVGPTAECNQLSRGYPSIEGAGCPGASPVMRRCGTYNSIFKPKVAQEAFQCFQGFKGRACNGCFHFSCGHKALMHACPDPTADADCDKIEQSCSGMGHVQCRSYLSGMTARGRKLMVDCLTKSCGKGFGACLVGIQ